MSRARPDGCRLRWLLIDRSVVHDACCYRNPTNGSTAVVSTDVGGGSGRRRVVAEKHRPGRRVTRLDRCVRLRSPGATGGLRRKHVGLRPSRVIRGTTTIPVDSYRLVASDTIYLLGTHARDAVLYVVPAHADRAPPFESLRGLRSWPWSRPQLREPAHATGAIAEPEHLRLII